MDDSLHLSHLCVTIHQFDAKDDVVLLYIVEHLHHLVVQELLRQTGCRNLNATKALSNKALCLITEARIAQLRHTETEETVRIALLYLQEITILQAVDELLGDDSR